MSIRCLKKGKNVILKKTIIFLHFLTLSYWCSIHPQSIANAQNFNLQSNEVTTNNTVLEHGWSTQAIPHSNKSQKSGQPTNIPQKQLKVVKPIAPNPDKIHKKSKLDTQVRIISSLVGESNFSMSNDLARLLRNDKKLRIVPIAGRDSAQNLKDLYYLKGVDLGIIQLDVLKFYRNNSKLPKPEKFIRYITRLAPQEIHLIARKDISNLNDLEGKRVSIGLKAGSRAITANAIFKAFSLNVSADRSDTLSALHKLKVGEIDAAVLISGKPDGQINRFFQNTRDFHLININFNDKLKKSYQPSVIINEDYPNLIPKNQVVSTVSVDTILAMYNWSKGSHNYQKVENFVKSFFSRLQELRPPLYHHKWNEVDLAHDLPGWQRFQPAKQWLRKNLKSKRRVTNLPQQFKH